MMENWDFIIVGAGSAGCVLAERLSASPGVRVLLLEEGGPDNGWVFSMPKGLGRMPPDRLHLYQTEFDRGEDAPAEMWKRGKVLGGSSSVNGMVWVRCQPEDFDRLRDLGNDGWSWKDMLPHFRSLEDHELGESGMRGVGGPIAVRAAPPKTAVADAFIAATAATGVPIKDDINGDENQIGVSYVQANISRGGKRQSASATLLKRAAGRPNLHIRTGTRATRVIFEGWRAVGIEARTSDGLKIFRTNGEVILCAGAVASPAILQRSGVGDAGHLKSLGIVTVAHAPGVGKNLREHFVLGMQFEQRHQSDSTNREYSGMRLYANALRYFATGSGVLGQSVADAIAFLKCESGVSRADAELLFAPHSLDFSTGQFNARPGMTVYASVLRPESRGCLHLVSRDPDVPPRIQPNYLNNEYDRRIALAVVRRVREIAATPPLCAHVVREIAPTAGAETDDEIIATFKRWASAGFHTTGTCSMGQDDEAVVDERLRVRGVSGVRVVDCSIFPEMLSGNTNAPVMALASRAAALILEELRATPGGSALKADPSQETIRRIY